jgi:hypothetical protein
VIIFYYFYLLKVYLTLRRYVGGEQEGVGGNGVGCAERTGRHMVLTPVVSILVINILKLKKEGERR